MNNKDLDNYITGHYGEDDPANRDEITPCFTSDKGEKYYLMKREKVIGGAREEKFYFENENGDEVSLIDMYNACFEE